jgi:ribosomal protein S18 acetylase RimI-like enzyme
MIQEAVVEDLDALVTIENRIFNADRLSRRSLRYLLTRANATTFVDKEQEDVRGYAIVLYNTGTSLARLYSLGVDPDFRGHGIGAKLLEVAEQDARNNDCVTMRLEVRSDNVSAINLYKKQGTNSLMLFLIIMKTIRRLSASKKT